uniref:NADH dehydrogenase subunit 4 n=1 Tax=Halistemma rubrum TaxID=316183 RepID=UPI0026E28EC2|nr:NADH dehydrogenase subunit 4 [Halistemma rubrum]WJJ70218.1 NADH dehydrogenase subunit 4 [Halistemma rubrum]
MYLITFIFFIIILFINRNKIITIKKLSLLFSLIILFIFTIQNLKFSNFSDLQYTKINMWGNPIGLTLSNTIFYVDGISHFFIGLSIMLTIICYLISWENIEYLNKEFIILIFLTLIILIGVFTTSDLLIFYILFESSLIPLFLLIGIWGSRDEKIKAAFYFFFYTLIGSLLMLMSIFKIYSLIGSTNTIFINHIDIPSNYQFWFFIGFTISFAVKVPMIPVHVWLPQAHVEAPLAGSVLLAGILLKLGGYGFIRFLYPLFPIAFQYFSPFIILLSLIAVIYGGLTTCRQNDMKRLIAYSSVAHMGFVSLAIFTHSFEGLCASILMMLAHGLSSSGLFMTAGVLYARFHSRIIKYFKGLTVIMPILSSITLILILANIGFPLTFNFIAEFFTIISAYNYSWIVGVLSSIGLILSTVYALYFYNRIFFGHLSTYLITPRQITLFEFHPLILLIIFILIFGLKPDWLSDIFLFSCYKNISF